MRDSMMPGLEGVDQYPGHLEAQISLHLIFFFLWGYIKNIVYAEKIWNIQHLPRKDHISRHESENVEGAKTGAYIEMY
jgi:hypothetical protein